MIIEGIVGITMEKNYVLGADQNSIDRTMSTSIEVTTCSTLCSEGWSDECRPDDGAAGSNEAGVSSGGTLARFQYFLRTGV